MKTLIDTKQFASLSFNFFTVVDSDGTHSHFLCECKELEILAYSHESEFEDGVKDAWHAMCEMLVIYFMTERIADADQG